MDTQTRHALKHDALIDSANTGIGWFQQNQKNVIAASIAVVVVLALLLGGIAFYQNRNEKADVAFGKAMDAYGAPLNQPGQPAQPGVTTYNSVVERARAANALFLETANTYGFTRAGHNARYFAGLTDIEMGNPAAAEKDLKDAASSGSRDSAALAKLALATLYHQTGRDSDAAQVLNDLAAKPTTTVPAFLAKLQLAGIYESTKPELAKQIYAQLKDQDKTGEAGQIATQKLATLK